jgi:hypothetical protein
MPMNSPSPSMPYEAGYWELAPAQSLPPLPEDIPDRPKADAAVVAYMGSLMTSLASAEPSQRRRIPVEPGRPLPVIYGNELGLVRAIVDLKVTVPRRIFDNSPAARLPQLPVGATAASVLAIQAFHQKSQDMVDTFWYVNGRAYLRVPDGDQPAMVSRNVMYFRGLPDNDQVVIGVDSAYYNRNRRGRGRVKHSMFLPMDVGAIYEEPQYDGGAVLSRIVQAETVRPRDADGDARSPKLLAALRERARAYAAAGRRMLPAPQ